LKSFKSAALLSVSARTVAEDTPHHCLAFPHSISTVRAIITLFNELQWH